MKITESQLKQIIEEETEEVLQEIAPALAALGGAAARGAAALGGAAAKGVAKGAAKLGTAAAKGLAKGASKAAGQAAKMVSKQTDVNKVLQGLNRIKAPTLMQKIDKPLELQDLLMNVLGNVKVDPKVVDTVLNKVRTQLKVSAKQQAAATQQQAAQTDPVGQPPAE